MSELLKGKEMRRGVSYVISKSYLIESYISNWSWEKQTNIEMINNSFCLYHSSTSYVI